MSEKLELAKSYWACEKKRDLPAVLNHFAEDAVFRAPTMTLNGRDEIERYYADVLQNFKDVDVEVCRAVEQGDYLIVEWFCKLIGNDDKLREVLGCNVFTIQNQKFARLNVYFNPADFA